MVINMVPTRWPCKNSSSKLLVCYLTLVSDLDLAPPTDQFVASPPVRYINPGYCVKERCPGVVKI